MEVDCGSHHDEGCICALEAGQNDHGSHRRVYSVHDGRVEMNESRRKYARGAMVEAETRPCLWKSTLEVHAR